MNQIVSRGPLGLKSEHEAPDPDRMAKVAAMPCVICFEYSMPQLSRTTVHHCIMGRHSYDKRQKKRRRAPDSMTIPLCEGHHQGLLDKTKVALHHEPERWKRLYGEDTRFISWVEERL